MPAQSDQTLKTNLSCMRPMLCPQTWACMNPQTPKLACTATYRTLEVLIQLYVDSKINPFLHFQGGVLVRHQLCQRLAPWWCRHLPRPHVGSIFFVVLCSRKAMTREFRYWICYTTPCHVCLPLPAGPLPQPVTKHPAGPVLTLLWPQPQVGEGAWLLDASCFKFLAVKPKCL